MNYFKHFINYINAIINKYLKTNTNNMKRKTLNTITFISLILSWAVLIIFIIYIFFPKVFEHTEKVYYEPQEQTN